MTAYERKKELYREYVKELCETSGGKYSEVDADSNFEEYINSSTAKWINIIDSSTEDDIFAGFIIIGKDYPNKHPLSNYSVAEAFVEKKYRGKGLCYNTFKPYLDRHPGIWSLLVFSENTEARTYWQNLFVKASGYRLVDSVIDNGSEREDCRLVLFLYSNEV